MILSGLRKLGSAIRTEVQQMPILDDIMDHDVLGPAIRQGRQEGGQDILRGQLNKRFGEYQHGWMNASTSFLLLN
jgi:hypothetical protein